MGRTYSAATRTGRTEFVPRVRQRCKSGGGEIDMFMQLSYALGSSLMTGGAP